MWQINEQGLPGVGQVDETQISDLITLSNLAIGVEDTGVLAGFVLCLPPGTRYGSLTTPGSTSGTTDFCMSIDRRGDPATGGGHPVVQMCH